MTPNNLGKLLVLVNLALSLLFMTWGGAIFLQQMDWGWKEPRKDITGSVRIPSEIDQRTVAVTEAQKAVELVKGPLKSAQQLKAGVEPWLPLNRIWYQQQLASLRSGPDALDVKEVKYDKGVLVEDKKAFMRPVLENPTGISKSYAKYSEDLLTLHKSIEDTEKQINKALDEQKTKTHILSGKDNEGKDVGLFALLEKEHQIQQRLKFEKEYLLPRWVGALEEVQLFLERRARLDATLEKLKKARTGGGTQ